jgi:hypothetical protein
MKNKNIQILMVSEDYFKKMMANLPGLPGVSEKEDLPGLVGVKEDDKDDDDDEECEKFKAGYMKGYEDGLTDSKKEKE